MHKMHTLTLKSLLRQNHFCQVQVVPSKPILKGQECLVFVRVGTNFTLGLVLISQMPFLSREVSLVLRNMEFE